MKAGSAAGAGFAPMETMARIPELPFQKAWYQPGVSWEGYTEIVIVPVDTSHIQQLDWWKALGRGQKLAGDLPKLADYTQQAFERAFEEDPNRRFLLIRNQPLASPQALVLELALTEVVPSKVTLNAIGYAPFVGTAARIIRGKSARSTVAFEARIKDASSGKMLAAFADREAEKFAPVSLKDLTWYGHAHAIIERWARQFVLVLARKPGEQIKDSPAFTLKPW